LSARIISSYVASVDESNDFDNELDPVTISPDKREKKEKKGKRKKKGKMN
jgi:hypothetical protein